MATINFETEYLKQTVLSIIQLIVKNGFVYISHEDLDEDYDGNFTEFYNILGGKKPT